MRMIWQLPFSGKSNNRRQLFDLPGIYIIKGENVLRRKKMGFWRHFIFLGPASIAFAIAVMVPFLISIVYSFTDWNGVANEIKFVGFKNFIDIFTGKADFLDAFWFTAKLAIVTVVLVNVIGTLLAVALTSAIKFKGLFRVSFYLPNTIGGLVLGFIWQFIFINGFPALGDKLHLAFMKLPWLGTETTAFIAIVIVTVWQSVGYIMIIMTAALTGVPMEMIESAKIDGANAFQRFFKVRLPMCISYITVCLFWTISGSFKTFDLVYSLTKGGPYASTNTLAMRIYNDAFANNKYGLATAESLIFFIIIMVITGVQMYFSTKKEKELL